MKMPLITTSHLCESRAGSRPGNAVWTNFAFTFQSFAITPARSMSKPTGLPLVVVDSIGGKVGSLQYLSEPFTGEVTRWLAPAVPTTARAAIKASRESGPTRRFIAPPLLASIQGRVQLGSIDPSANRRGEKMQIAQTTPASRN